MPTDTLARESFRQKPRLDPSVSENDLVRRAPSTFQRSYEARLVVGVRNKHHVATATCARHFAGACSVLACHCGQCLKARIGDGFRRSLLGFPRTVENFHDSSHIASYYGLLHIERISLEIVHERDRPEKHTTIELSSSFRIERRNPQRIDDYTIVGHELNEIHATKCRRILILLAAIKRQIDAFGFFFDP